MLKIKNLFNFLIIGVFLSVIVLFIGNLFGFSLGFNFDFLFRILVGFLVLILIINLKEIKGFLKSSTFIKKFILLSLFSLLAISLFLLLYPMFRFGSPLIWEDRIANFKAVKKLQIELNEPLKQSFQAESNNLGTIGLKIISQDLVVNGDEGVEEELPSDKTDKIVFRIKEDREEIKDYFYENTYELNQYWQTDYFLFGFPIQYESKDKSYFFEIEKIEEGETGKTFLLEINSEGNFNFYPRYVYSLKELKSNYQPILSNVSRKTNQFLEEKNNQVNLIFVFFLIELLILGFLKKEEKSFIKKFNPYFQYGFLIGLLLIVISSLNFEFIKNISYLQNVINNLSEYSFSLTSLTIALGFLVFYFNRKKIEKDVEEEKNNEELLEEKRAQEFPQKFPTINKIPLLRNFIGWCYKEGWRYSLGLIAIFVIVAFVFSYRIGSYEFREDEFQVAGAAAGYYYTGNFYQWDWLENKLSNISYTRAWPHTWLIAQSYKIFGVSEWSSRIVSVLFGLIFVPIIYFVTKYFTETKKIALLSTFAILFYPSFINIFRYTRMYSALLPILLILFYLSYRGITEKNKINFKPKRLNNFINKNLDFNYLFLILALILLIINYFMHINSLIILPILFLFIVYLAITKRERKYIIAGLMGLFGALCLFLIYYLGLTNGFLGFLSFFGVKNFIYINYLIQYPFSFNFGILILIFGISFIFISNGLKKDKLTYFYITLITSLVFFIWIANRYAGFLYISHISTISIILIIAVYFWVIRLLKKKYIKILLYLILFLFILTSFYQEAGKIYGEEQDFGRFKEAYLTIKKNLNPEEKVIFGQYLRTYYLKEIGEDNLIVIDMLNNGQYSYESFLKDISKYDSGWITWETRKGYHIKEEIKNYINKNFKKYHGRGIDGTNVEVYYFDQTMIE